MFRSAVSCGCAGLATIALLLHSAVYAPAADGPSSAPAPSAALPAAAPAAPAAKDGWQSLFDGKTLSGWKAPELGGEGKVAVKDASIVLEIGGSMTGVTCTAKTPKIDYELTLEGMRVEGSDFFCTTTFPVGEDSCSLVVGGWGGQLVGLSSLDGMDASENDTTQSVDFQNNRWYRIRILVTRQKIQAWIDKEKAVDAAIAHRKVSTRWECEPFRPLGISTWNTKGAVRDLRIRKLTAEEVAGLAPEKEPE